jgi:hypothetical protein
LPHTMKDLTFPTTSHLAQTPASKHYGQITSHRMYDHIHTKHPRCIKKVY